MNLKPEIEQLAARILPGLPRSIFIGITSQLDEAIRVSHEIDEDEGAYLRLGLTGADLFNLQLQGIRRRADVDDRELERLAKIAVAKLIGVGFQPASIATEVEIIREKIDAHVKRTAEINQDNANAAAALRAAQIQADAEALTPREIITQAEATGVQLFAEGGAVRVHPAHRLGEPHLGRIRARKADIVLALQERAATSAVA
jgi:hypothetical protein